MADNGTERDPTQYDPRWHAIEEGPILIGGALYAALLPCHLVIWEHQHIPGTDSIYFDLDNHPLG